MFRTTLGLISAAIVGLATSQSATADDWYFSYGPSRSYYYRHGSVHNELEHSAYHRELEHSAAHQYPMSWRQHEGLHDSLNHEAYHDAVDHSRWHGSRGYRYNGGGVYLGGGRSRIYVTW